MLSQDFIPLISYLPFRWFPLSFPEIVAPSSEQMRGRKLLEDGRGAFGVVCPAFVIIRLVNCDTSQFSLIVEGRDPYFGPKRNDSEG